MKRRHSILISASVLPAAILPLIPRIAQPLSYHDFADQRSVLGTTNALNVWSNIGFFIVGVWALAWLRSERDVQVHRSELPFWRVFFAGVTLTAFGSAYYHLDPNNSTLVWDRLPMTVGFMGVLAAVIAERIDLTLAKRLLPALLIVGAASVFYWSFTEQRGVGDLRLYGIVQFYSLALLLLVIGMYRPRYTHGGAYIWAIVAYVAAKLFESFDRQVYSALHFISGHSLKHIAAALGAWILLRMLQHRQAVASCDLATASV